MSQPKQLENIKYVCVPPLIHYSLVNIIDIDKVTKNDILEPIHYDGPPPLIYVSQNKEYNVGDPQITDIQLPPTNDDSGLTYEQKIYIKSNYKEILANTPLNDYEHKPNLSRLTDSKRIQMREESVLYIKINNNKRHRHIENFNTQYTFNNDVYECNTCHNKFQSMYSLKYHILHKHTQCEFKYNCTKCKYQNDNKSHFRNHFRYQHGLDIDIVLK